jgi:hypothetical protein
VNLKDFIKETIGGIVEAAKELRDDYFEDGVLINPPVSVDGDRIYGEDSSRHTFRRIEEVEFDLAVTASSESSGKGRVGIKVFSAEAGVHGDHQRKNEEVSRVRFKIPLTLPPNVVEADNRNLARSHQRLDQKSFEDLGKGLA